MIVAELRERHPHDLIVGEREPHVARRAFERAAELYPFDGVARVTEALGDRIARKFENLRRRQRLAEKQRRRLRQLMRFVEDHRVRIRQQLGHAGVAQHDVREEQMMVDDDDVGLLRFAPRLHHEAFLVVRTLLAEAVVARRRDHRPYGRRLRHARELGLVAAFRDLRETDDLLQIRGVLPRRQAAVVRGALQIVVAQIVRAALQHRDRHRHRERVAHGRNVAQEQLVLQMLRASRHDHLAAPQHCRHEIRIGLAGAGAGLDDQRVVAGIGVGFVRGVAHAGVGRAAPAARFAEPARRPLARFEDFRLRHPARGRLHRGRDRTRHLDLRCARTIAVERARQQPAVAENRVEFVDALAAQFEGAFGRTNAPGRRVAPGIGGGFKR
ncbi:hypothetical protein FEP87_02222 [Burkholderia multivorans]|nr:hypothetical protein [Burkholderia multivorans]